MNLLPSSAAAVVVVIAAMMMTLVLAQEQIDIKRYNIEPGSLSVSGISAGGFMAAQFQVAFSKSVKGSGIIAGGPYDCAQGQMLTALMACMKSPSSISLSSIAATVSSYEKQGLIDPTSNIKNHKIYLFSGTQDSVVAQGVMTKLLDQYTNNFGVSKSNIVTDFNTPAQHSMITNDYGNSCGYLGSPYINNCGIDGAGNVFKQVYPDFKTGGSAVSGNLFTYKQSGRYSASSLDSNGYIYIPTACQQGASCKISIAFHGCNQGASVIGTSYVANAGYNKHAELNNIIVVYPQVAVSYFNPMNSQGCFDWFGYSGSSYATKQGSQMAAIANLITDLGYTL
ncbi:hypothetical protein C9374_006592 [Naegleria lovaniensis]|uniref:Polyhydroxybutyrate depolymerase n=1 Tax=Naegleria lovaniensis TaxID=51637 RepID=A0AA88GME3_NAELO|nr:uncharacterized protein C9374_006592 [Naegleria lovaniensis]KAG2379475.1 hypothetical protein C9374_006592 [Naegleria lovaniensis]